MCHCDINCKCHVGIYVLSAPNDEFDIPREYELLNETNDFPHSILIFVIDQNLFNINRIINEISE